MLYNAVQNSDGTFEAAPEVTEIGTARNPDVGVEVIENYGNVAVASEGVWECQLSAAADVLAAVNMDYERAVTEFEKFCDRAEERFCVSEAGSVDAVDRYAKGQKAGKARIATHMTRRYNEKAAKTYGEYKSLILGAFKDEVSPRNDDHSIRSQSEFKEARKAARAAAKEAAADDASPADIAANAATKAEQALVNLMTALDKLAEVDAGAARDAAERVTMAVNVYK